MSTRSDHLRVALAAAKMHTWSWDIKSGHVEWSEGIESLVGLPPGSFGGTFDAYQRVLHPEDRPAVLASIQAALDDERATYDIEHRILRPDGGVRWLACRGQVLRTSEGTPIRMLGVVWDTTARKDVESRAASLERRLAFLADAGAILGSSLDYPTTLAGVAKAAVPRVADWCIVELAELADEDGRHIPPVAAHVDPSKVDLVLEVGRRYRKIATGTRVHGIPGVILSGESELNHEISQATLEEQTRADPDLLPLYRELGVASSMVVPIRARELTLGAILLVSADPARLFDDDDLAMATDLGKRAGVAVDNARLYADAREADRRKDDFLAMLGHELRNPLAPILTAIELMRLRGVDTFERERTIIARQVQHVVRLVDDLLDVSRIARGKISIRKERIEIAEVIGRSVEIASPMFELRSQNLTVTVQPTGLLVMADQGRLAQAVANVLINAAKFTPPRGQISLTATREGADLVIRVRDSGIGITAETLPHIFDLFMQHSRTLDRAQGGLGLGLSIVKSLVSLHGGSVSAESEGLGKGSELIIRLPAAAEMSAAGENGGEAAPKRDRQGRRVLIVDDNYDAATLLADALGALGYRTYVAFDGPSALAAVPTFNPELALVDIGLPVMDGYELARRLRENASTAQIPLVAITGYGQESDRERAREAGFDAHLVKPVDLKALLAVMGRLQEQFGGEAMPAH